MKKILIAIGIYCSVWLQSQAQFRSTFIEKAVADTSEGTYKKLKFVEANFVSSYYTQKGNHSAVTGGIGTEALFDIANAIDLKMSYQASPDVKHSLGLDINVDYYSSASSDNIDPRSISGASKEDVHFYPSLAYSRTSEKNKNTLGANLAYSTEWDYTSYGGGINYASQSADNNTEFTFKANAFFDTWQVILPIELRTGGARGRDNAGQFKARNSYNIGFGISRVINRNLQMMIMAEPSYQEGLLSTPYHRVYFTDNSLKVEKLPGTRVKFPVSLRTSYFLGDRFVIRSLYRYYRDDWGMQAHTVSAEMSVKVTPFLSVTPHYRFNSQTAVRYFAANKKHPIGDAFYTSDYDISDFNSGFWGAGVRFSPPGGILGNRWWKSAELRYGHYNRSDGMVSHIISLTTKIN
jgi:Protein of unknown function (DUF3570)